MDYEFRYDPIDQKVIALFSMGHEVVGYWLNEEINGDLALLEYIETQAKQVAKTVHEWAFAGKAFSLLLDREEVRIRANELDFAEDEMAQDMNYYDEESIAFCGLEDFLLMLAKYREFVLYRESY